MAFPKLSAPLVKDIRTGEGIAEWALGAGITALTAVGDFSVVHGVTTLTILAALKGIRRGLIKCVGLMQGVIGSPLEPAQLLSTVDTVAGKVGSAVEAVATDPATTDPAPAPATTTTTATVGA